MIAKIVAMLISEGTSVEGAEIGMDMGMAKVGIKHSTSCRLQLCHVECVSIHSCFGPSDGTWEEKNDF